MSGQIYRRAEEFRKRGATHPHWDEKGILPPSPGAEPMTVFAGQQRNNSVVHQALTGPGSRASVPFGLPQPRLARTLAGQAIRAASPGPQASAAAQQAAADARSAADQAQQVADEADSAARPS